MNNLENFQIFLELLVLIVTLSSQSPWLGIAAVVGALLCLFIDGDESDNGEG
ncbi:MAG: hypothetical protein F6K31_10470 [Symploca sp. SIO2G7]|nr:hypothetical protein [Symploca sp. SIO2G7]